MRRSLGNHLSRCNGRVRQAHRACSRCGERPTYSSRDENLNRFESSSKLTRLRMPRASGTNCEVLIPSHRTHPAGDFSGLAQLIKRPKLLPRLRTIRAHLEFHAVGLPPLSPTMSAPAGLAISSPCLRPGTTCPQSTTIGSLSTQVVLCPTGSSGSISTGRRCPTSIASYAVPSPPTFQCRRRTRQLGISLSNYWSQR